VGKVKFKEDACKGCRLCMSVCPKKILKIDETKVNPKGYHPVTCTDLNQCTGCTFCAVMCPDLIIEVYR